MIEILNKIDIHKVNDENIKKYLEYSLTRLPNNFVYPDLGYFVVIEKFQELTRETIKLTNHSLNGIDNGLYDDINMVEIKDEVIELLVFVDSDITIGLILLIDMIPIKYQNELRAFVLE